MDITYLTNTLEEIEQANNFDNILTEAIIKHLNKKNKNNLREMTYDILNNIINRQKYTYYNEQFLNVVENFENRIEEHINNIIFIINNNYSAAFFKEIDVIRLKELILKYLEEKRIRELSNAENVIKDYVEKYFLKAMLKHKKTPLDM